MKLSPLCLLWLTVPALAQSENTVISAPAPPPVVMRREMQNKSADKAKDIDEAKADLQIQTAPYSIGEPSDDEQLYLEFINRARADPTAEGLRMAVSTDPQILTAYTQYGVNLNLMKSEFAALPVRPPLALNVLLSNAAKLHTQFMFDTAEQTHTGSGNSNIGNRADAAGYNWIGLSENVYCFASGTFHGHAGFQVDWGPGPGGMQTGRGHRVAIHANYREVGIGVLHGTNKVGSATVGPQLVTQDFGTDANDTPFVTGVAYHDLNANNFYDVGEGIGGLTVAVDGAAFHAVTSASGGYAVPVPIADASRAVTFTGLNANGVDTAVLSGGANVKVDFKPAFVPATLSGNDAIQTGVASNYTFNAVLGATGYKGRTMPDTDAAADGADDLVRVVGVKTGSYSNTSTSVKFAGSGSYRLTCPAAGPQTLEYQSSFLVKAGASLSFRSRLGSATADQVARAEVSTNNGLSWQTVYTQAGTGFPGEASFQTRTVPLSAYLQKTVKIRFNFSYESGTFFNQTSDGVGWYIDTISFANMVDTSASTVSTLPPGTTLAFTPSISGNYLLSVSPIISGRDLGYGPTKSVLVTNSPPSLAEIEVEQPAASGLVDGVSSVSFGTKYHAQSEILTFTVRNSGVEDLTGLSLSVSGTHAAEFVASDPGSVLLTPGMSTTFTVTFRPTASGPRVATLRIISNDANENPFDISLTGRGTNAPTIGTPPAPLIRAEGAQATLTVIASHPTLTPTYTWKKNGVLVKGATTASLNISAVKLTDAGNYSVVVSAAGESTESAAVVLAVVRPVSISFVQLAGSTIKPAVTVSGAASLVWKKTSGSLPVVEILTTPTPATLTLASLSAASGTAVYTCEASVPSGMLVAGTFNVKVFNAKPQITIAQNMPNGQVSRTYTHQILCDGGSTLFPSSYSMTPSIPGLTLNTTSGLITGKPTVAKDYTVTLTARNSLGPSSTTANITITSLPGNVEGIYAGTISRSAVLNANLGGRVDLTVANTGGISGALILGTLRYAFTGAMDISLAAPPLAPEATITVKRTGTLLPLTLKFILDTANQRFTTASVTDGSNTAQIQGWRLIWKATGTPLNPATPASKLFTFSLKPPALPATLPRGDGYGSFTLDKDGKLNLTGKTGDGESYTCSTFAGPQGQVLLFGTLLSKGSLIGQLDIGLASDILSGTISWMRPANVASRTYPLGFGPVDLTAVGAKYTPPTSPALVLGMALGDKAQISFDEGGLSTAAINPDVTEFDILANNVAKLPIALAAGNLGSVKITSLSATTGLFSGSFILDDTELRASPAFAGNKLKRPATFTGILTHDGVSQIGAGHFLLPELPRDANNAAVPPIRATTKTTSQIFSGSVLMGKKP